MSESFQIAAERARERFGQEKWDKLTTQEQAAAIYQELRELDAEIVRQRTPPPNQEQRGCFTSSKVARSGIRDGR